MRKLFSVLTVIALVMIYACGGDNPKAVINDYLNASDTFATDMGKAASADDVVAALNKMTATFKELVPRMKALEKQYPNIKNIGKNGEFPEEFKEFKQKFEELGPKMMGAFAGAMKYISDPKVQEAQKKFEEITKEM